VNGPEVDRGILFDNPEEDIFEIHRIIQNGIVAWNSAWATREGVVLGIKEGAVEVASYIGGGIMFKSFPTPPDAFKRVAALLVTMALHPFITGRAGNKDGMYVNVLQGDDLRPFAIRFIVDSLPIIFRNLDQKDDKGEWITLNQWPGFGCVELRDEFIKLLLSISRSDVFEWKEGVITYNQPRLARGMLAVSLTLKAVYGRVERT
jgi:hypothetical protein